MIKVKSIEMPQPRAPHDETLSNPHLTIESADQSTLICYCARHHCGALYALELERWTMYAPITLAQFVAILDDEGLEVPSSDAFKLWFDAVKATIVANFEAANDD